jgi:two-component system cell cycle sensor histidine kinase/response regulator CckA
MLDIASFVRETMSLSRASVPTTIKIEERVEAAQPILADSGQLHQVILNLVTNAAQAIGDETGAITIELANDEHAMADREDPAPKSCVRLSISDTGCGMEEATLNRIFEPFFTTKGVGQGTGLGLSVVHGIVAEHGGSIEVTSQPGLGTRFDIFLPAHDSEHPELCERNAAA